MTPEEQWNAGLAQLREDERCARAVGYFDWADTVRQMADFLEHDAARPPWRIIANVASEIGWEPEEEL